MGQLEPPSARSQLFFIGKDSRGNWVVFAMFENGYRPQAVVMVPGVFELDLSGKPSVVEKPRVDTDAPRSRWIPEGLLPFPPKPAAVPA
jgi:hypothetical protein